MCGDKKFCQDNAFGLMLLIRNNLTVKCPLNRSELAYHKVDGLESSVTMETSISILFG